MVNYYSLPAHVRSLSNNVLGINVLRDAMRHNRDYHLELKVENGALAGYAVYSYNDEVGYIDSVVVDDTFRGSGYGKSLVLKVIKNLSLVGCDRAIALVRRPPGAGLTPIENMLLDLGFRRFMEDSRYYNKSDCQYTCNVCDEIPDVCSAVFYQLTF